jgi:hypothetical protein
MDLREDTRLCSLRHKELHHLRRELEALATLGGSQVVWCHEGCQCCNGVWGCRVSGFQGFRGVRFLGCQGFERCLGYWVVGFQGRQGSEARSAASSQGGGRADGGCGSS